MFRGPVLQQSVENVPATNGALNRVEARSVGSVVGSVIDPIVNPERDTGLDKIIGPLRQHSALPDLTKQSGYAVQWEAHKTLSEIKNTLRNGLTEANGQKTTPFVFHLVNGRQIPAETPGLEGFVFTERRIAQKFGEEQSMQLLPHYINHSQSLLSSLGRSVPLQKITDIESSTATPLEKYKHFISYLRSYVDELRHEVHQSDPALYSHASRTYHIFSRAFNHEGWRKEFSHSTGPLTGRFFADFDDADCEALKERSFTDIRLMGVFPIGTVLAKGDAGGSPFAVKKYEVDPRYGTADEVRAFVARAAKHGIATTFELVPNHTSADADLLSIDPRLYVHIRQKPANDEGYFHYVSPEHGEYWIRHGGYYNGFTRARDYWKDTLQLDYSNHDTRDFVIAEVKDMIRTYGIQKFRVDSAYQMLNRYLAVNWNEEMQGTLPQREFLQRMITEVKTEFPGVAFVAEAFDGWDELSECGFDLIYGINDMQRRGGHLHQGWNNSIKSRDPERIRNAIERAEFLHWQEGGADIVTFYGQHDSQSPWRDLGAWAYGAATLTIMKPGAFSAYAGADAMYEAPCAEDGKIITFNKSASIDWSKTNSDPLSSFVQGRLKEFAKYEAKYGAMKFYSLFPTDGNREWVGYMIQPAGAGTMDEKVLVIANPTDHDITVNIDMPEYGIHLKDFALKKCGPRCSEVIEYPSQHEITALKLSA